MTLIEQTRAELVGLLPRLRRFGYALTGSPHDGDDLVQSACERALVRLDQFQAGTRLDSWMYRIMQNLWIDHRRSARAQRETGVEAADLELLAVGDARRDLDSSLSLAAARRAMGELPEEQRAVLVLVCIEGLSYKEAAGVLDIPIGTVMSRLARARIAVGAALDESPTVAPGAKPRGGRE